MGACWSTHKPTSPAIFSVPGDGHRTVPAAAAETFLSKMQPLMPSATVPPKCVGHSPAPGPPPGLSPVRGSHYLPALLPQPHTVWSTRGTWEPRNQVVSPLCSEFSTAPISLKPTSHPPPAPDPHTRSWILSHPAALTSSTPSPAHSALSTWFLLTVPQTHPA